MIKIDTTQKLYQVSVREYDKLIAGKSLLKSFLYISSATYNQEKPNGNLEFSVEADSERRMEFDPFGVRIDGKYKLITEEELAKIAPTQK